MLASRVVTSQTDPQNNPVARRRTPAKCTLAHAQISTFPAACAIDLAVWGIPPERFYSAVAAVGELSPLFRIDLVDPAVCRPALLQTIEAEGVEL